MANMWQLRKETDICSQCIETNAYKIDDPCLYYQDILEQQEITVDELQIHKGKGHRFALKQKQHIAMQKLKIKKLQKLRELDMKNAEETIEQIQADANEVLAEIKEAKISEVQTAQVSPFLYGAAAVLLIAVIVGGLLLWFKVKRLVDGKIGPAIDRHLTNWLADHVIGETGSYTDGNFTLNIKHKDEVRHGGSRENGNNKHSRSGSDTGSV